jgi:hypothetical protein
MAAQWGLPADAFVLSGEVSAVETTLDRWTVPRTRDPRTGALTHPNLVYVMDRTGRIAYATSGNADAIEQLVKRLSADN